LKKTGQSKEFPTGVGSAFKNWVMAEWGPKGVQGGTFVGTDRKNIGFLDVFDSWAVFKRKKFTGGWHQKGAIDGENLSGGQNCLKSGFGGGGKSVGNVYQWFLPEGSQIVWGGGKGGGLWVGVGDTMLQLCRH